MRRSATQSLGDVLRDYIRENNIGKKLKESDIVNSWEEVLGKTIAHYTRNIAIKNRILYVEISSAVVKNELFLIRGEIVKKLNEKAGEELIDKIVFR
jgi:predicted nucleic acid-binding Zn ribbon protein